MIQRGKYKEGAESSKSDSMMLLKLEDMINLAMGPSDQNVVNFKLLQTVLYILARQMRMLGQQVELKAPDDRATSTSDDSKQQQKEKREHSEKSSAKKREKEGPTDYKDTGKEERAEHKEKEERGERKERDKQQEDVVDDIEKEGSKSKSEKEKKDKGEIDKEKREKSGAEKEKDKKEAKGKGKLRDAEADDDSKKQDTDGGKSVTGKKSKKGLGERSSAISVTEREGPGKEKILVVEKGASTPSGPQAPRVGNIEVVTQQEFEMLEKAVNKLKEMQRGPLAPPTLPDDKKLKDDLAKGSASLTDTMKAMQLSERVEAAEKSITRMSELLTELASKVALPETIVAQAAQLGAEVDAIKEEIAKADAAKDKPDTAATAVASKKSVVRPAGASKSVTTDAKGAESATAGIVGPSKSVMTDPKAAVSTIAGPVGPTKSVTMTDGKASMPTTVAPVGPSKSVMTAPKAAVSVTGHGGKQAASDAVGTGTLDALAAGAGSSGIQSVSTTARMSIALSGSAAITHAQMTDAIRGLGQELSKNMASLTSKAINVVDSANNEAKSVGEKMAVAMNLHNRLNALYALVGDYAEQLHGFEAGVATQLLGFQEQMAQMRQDLTDGLRVLEAVNTNPETAALVELRERYELIEADMAAAVERHRKLTACQGMLSDEFRSLVECVELMREEKADRDEVLDGLRDKADMSRLAGLVTQEQFAESCTEIDMRLDICFEKFNRQDAVWRMAIADFNDMADSKAEFSDLMALREYTQQMLQELRAELERLAVMMNEPRALILCRHLDIPTGPDDDHQESPPKLALAWSESGPSASVPSAASQPPPDLGLECTRLVSPGPDDDGVNADDYVKRHWCNRYCGGSHTVVRPPAATREHAPPAAIAAPAHGYSAEGTDGKVYYLMEELGPCEECNVLLAPKPDKDSIPGAADPPPGAAGDGTPHHRVTLIDASTLPTSHVEIKEMTEDSDQPEEGQGEGEADAAPEGEGEAEDEGRASRRVSIRPSKSLASPSKSVASSRLPSLEGVQRHSRKDIGTAIKGRVTKLDTQDVMRAVILRDIKEQRSKSRAHMSKMSQMSQMRDDADDSQGDEGEEVAKGEAEGDGQ